MTRTAKSLHLVIINAAILMMSYPCLRCSLSLFLNQYYGADVTLSIASMAIALQVAIGYIWSIIFQYFRTPNYRLLMILGALLSAGGCLILVLQADQPASMLLGLAIYINGIGIYFLNMKTLIGSHYTDPSKRQKASQLMFVGLNAGSLIGFAIGAGLYSLAVNLNLDDPFVILYAYVIVIITLTALMLLFYRKDIKLFDDKLKSDAHKLPTYGLIFAFLGMLLLTAEILTYSELARIIILVLILGYGIYYCLATSSDNHRGQLVVAILLTNMMFYIAVTIIYVQFSLFLHHQLHITIDRHHISELVLYTLDPVANLIAAYFIMGYLRRRLNHPNMILGSGLLLLTIAFAISQFGLNSHTHYLDIIWASLTILFFGFGEFLIAPTVVTQMTLLANLNNKPIRNYMGALFLSSAAGILCSYYLMQYGLSTKLGPIYSNGFSLVSETHIFSALVVTLLIVTFVVFGMGFVKYKDQGKPKDHSDVQVRGAQHA